MFRALRGRLRTPTLAPTASTLVNLGITALTLHRHSTHAATILTLLTALQRLPTGHCAARQSPTHPPTSAPAVSSQQHTNLTNTSAHYRHRASRYYRPLALHGPTPPHSAPCPTPTRLTQPPLCPRANTSHPTPGNTLYIIVRQHNSSTPYPPTPPRTPHRARISPQTQLELTAAVALALWRWQVPSVLHTHFSQPTVLLHTPQHVFQSSA